MKTQIYWCEECQKETEHYYNRGFPGNHYEPAEPEGWECSACGTWRDPDEPDWDAKYEDRKEMLRERYGE